MLPMHWGDSDALSNNVRGGDIFRDQIALLVLSAVVVACSVAGGAGCSHAAAFEDFCTAYTYANVINKQRQNVNRENTIEKARSLRNT